jgi:hypothetical protein
MNLPWDGSYGLPWEGSYGILGRKTCETHEIHDGSEMNGSSEECNRPEGDTNFRDRFQNYSH